MTDETRRAPPIRLPVQVVGDGPWTVAHLRTDRGEGGDWYFYAECSSYDTAEEIVARLNAGSVEARIREECARECEERARACAQRAAMLKAGEAHRGEIAREDEALLCASALRKGVQAEEPACACRGFGGPDGEECPACGAYVDITIGPPSRAGTRAREARKAAEEPCDHRREGARWLRESDGCVYTISRVTPEVRLVALGAEYEAGKEAIRLGGRFLSCPCGYTSEGSAGEARS